MSIFKKIFGFFKNYKSLALILIVFTTVFLLVFNANSSIIEKRNYDTAVSYDVSEDMMSIHDYTVLEDNFYISKSVDPQIYITPDNWPTTNDLTVRFAEPLKEQSAVQLFIASEDYEGIYNKDIPKGATEVFFTLPDDVYTWIRLDINGNFKLEGITASYLENVDTHKGLTVQWIPVITCFALFFVLTVLSFVFKDKVEAVYKKLLNKYFSTDNKDLCFEKKNARKLANRYALIALFFGTLLLIFMPALSVPDENSHFLNVLRVSHFQFVPSVKDGIEGVYLTSDEVAFLDEFGGINSSRMTWNRFFSIDFTNNYPSEFYATGWASTNFLGHFLPAMAVVLARFLFKGINIYTCLLVARFANLLISVLIIRYALKITPIFRNTMFLLALMPVFLQQAASVSYDAILNASTFLLFAITAKLVMESNDYRITAKDVFTVLLAVTGICTMKVPYTLLALVLFSINIKKFGSLKKYFMCIGGIVACGIIFCVIPNVAFNNATAEIVRPSNELSQVQIDFLLSDLRNIPRVFSETYKLCGQGWKMQFFGTLGWLDFKLPYACNLAFTVILFMTAAYDACTAGKVKFGFRISSIVSAMLVYGTIIISMYVLWNARIGELCGYVAHGAQGRYFIPIVMFIFVIFSNSLLVKFKHLRRLESNIMNITSMASVIFIITTIFAFVQRYWVLV